MVQQALRWHCPSPNHVFEVRTVSVYRTGGSVGYFNDTTIAANSIVNSDHQGLQGTYVTLNPVNPDALARCANHMMTGGIGTKDAEIVERRVLLIDFDPDRLGGISSSAAEHAAALAHMQNVSEDLTTWHGFPAPCQVDSGNGGHSRYLTEPMPNDPESTYLVKTFLQCMDARYSQHNVKIDTSVYNASRIVRIPGTVARKGEDTPERPHRVATLLRDFDPFDILPIEKLRRFVNLYQGLLPQGLRRLGVSKAKWFYPPDETIYRALNKTAMLDNIHVWVPAIFGDVAERKGGEYRISSKALGRDNEEDVHIKPTGIMDWGVHDLGDESEGYRTPVSLVSEWVTGDKRLAAEVLARELDCPINEFEANPILKPMKAELLTASYYTPATPVSPEPVIMPEALMGLIPYKLPTRYQDLNIFDLDTLQWTVRDFVLEAHYTLISAPTKIGKSTLARMLTASMLTGLPFLGRECPKQEVIYIAYEDNEGDIWQSVFNNIDYLLADAGVAKGSEEWLDLRHEARGRFMTYAAQKGETNFFDRVPRGRQGLDYMEQCLDDMPNCKAMMIDPMRFLRDEAVRSRDLVTQQYYEGMDFKNFSTSTGVSTIGLHHSNKESGKKAAENSDPVLAVGGTAAIGGAAGNVIVFQGDRVPEGMEGCVGLYQAGRIGSPKTIKIVHQEGKFLLAPDDMEIYYHRVAPKTKDPQVDMKIQQYIQTHGPSPVTTIADGIDQDWQLVNRRLITMAKRGICDKTPDLSGVLPVKQGAKPMLWYLIGPANFPKRVLEYP